MSPNKKIFLRIYCILSILLIINCGLDYFQEISLRGYYSDVILFWLWLICSFVVIVVFWKKIMAKLLLATLLVTLALSIIPMMMPFYALVLSTTSLGLHLNADLNENYRAQIVQYSPMAHPWLEVIEKKGVLEKRAFKYTDLQLINKNIDVEIRATKDIIFKSETDSTLTLTLFCGGPNTTITFNKKTGNVIDIKNN